MSKNELATVDEAPKFIAEVEEGVAPGMENMTGNDLILPRFSLMQALSVKVVDDEDPAISGQILNSLSGAVLIEKGEELEIIPLFHYKEWIQWGDRDANEGIIDLTVDPQHQLAQRAARGDTRTTAGGKEVRIVTEYHNFVCLAPAISLKIPITLSCCKTSYKTGKKMLSLSKFRGNYPLFAGMYALRGKLTQNKANQKYYIFDIENAGWVPDENMYAIAETAYGEISAAYKERRLRTDQDDSGEVEAPETEM